MPYSAWRDAVAAAEAQPVRKKGTDQVVAQPAQSALQRSRDKRKLQARLEPLEAKVGETETELATIEGRLSAPASPDSAIADAKLYEKTVKALEELMTEWELMAGQIDALD